MAGKIESRLRELGIELPIPPASAGSYVPFVVSGNLVFVSGQGPVASGRLRFPGVFGRELSVEHGKAAARLCALNILAEAKAAAGGDLDRIKRCVKVTAFVKAMPGFPYPHEIANGASDLFVEVFGEAGRHARMAIGVSALPRNIAITVDAVFEIARPEKT